MLDLQCAECGMYVHAPAEPMRRRCWARGCQHRALAIGDEN